ncbi:hypothetical protein ACP70R_034120 [Stipagrostis hirtigluma subsp. patula]
MAPPSGATAAVPAWCRGGRTAGDHERELAAMARLLLSQALLPPPPAPPPEQRMNPLSCGRRGSRNGGRCVSAWASSPSHGPAAAAAAAAFLRASRKHRGYIPLSRILHDHQIDGTN